MGRFCLSTKAREITAIDDKDMPIDRIPSDGGISTADIKALNDFSNFLPKLIQDCEWYVSSVYFQKRSRFVSVLAKYWDDTESSVDKHVASQIEKGCTEIYGLSLVTVLLFHPMEEAFP